MKVWFAIVSYLLCLPVYGGGMTGTTGQHYFDIIEVDHETMQILSHTLEEGGSLSFVDIGEITPITILESLNESFQIEAETPDGNLLLLREIVEPEEPTAQIDDQDQAPCGR